MINQRICGRKCPLNIHFHVFGLGFLCLANVLSPPSLFLPHRREFCKSAPAVRDSGDVLSRAASSPEDLPLLQLPVGSTH